jgi:putative protease
MRRDALNQLTALRGRRDNVMTLRMRKLPIFAGNKERPSFTVQVTSREQITQGLLRLNPAVLYVPLHILAEDPAFTRQLTKRFHVAAALPRIVHDGEMNALRDALRDVRKAGVEEALVGNIGLMLPVREAGMAIRGDIGLNIYNSLAMYTLKELELQSATLSFEMTMPQIRDVSKAVPCELLVYGRMPLMVTENCLFKGKTGKCACQLGPIKLVDKTGAEFPVIRDGKNCRSVLLNGKKLNWLDRQKDLSKLGLWAVRLYFTTENPQEVDRVLQSCISPTTFDPGACTRGLYLRGLD